MPEKTSSGISDPSCGIRRRLTLERYGPYLIILALANRPYLSFAYGILVAISTVYNAVTNAYSFALELSEGGTSLKSMVAYKELTEWFVASTLQKIYDFESNAIEYKLKINNMLFEKQKAAVKAQLQSEFCQKIFDYLSLPVLTEKYNLLSDLIKGILTEEKAEALKAKHITIASQQQHCECVEVRYTEGNNGENNIKNYYCLDMDHQLLDHFAISNDGAIKLTTAKSI